jgi:hypothetical protein
VISVEKLDVLILTCTFTSSSLSTPLPATLAENTPQLMHYLWKPFLHDINATHFLSKEGYRYKINKNNYRWSPLKKKLLILDVDTRLDTGAGAMMNKSPLNATEMTGRTAGMMNHYLYGMSYFSSTYSSFLMQLLPASYDPRL